MRLRGSSDRSNSTVTSLALAEGYHRILVSKNSQRNQLFLKGIYFLDFFLSIT